MDRVSDFCTRVRNATMAKHSKVDIPHSKLQQGIAEQLKSYGYIRGYKVAQIGARGLIRIYLKYQKQGEPCINKIESLSKPSRRRYVNAKEIPAVKSGYGLVVLSTNKGILSGEEAKDNNVGGEILFQVW